MILIPSRLGCLALNHQLEVLFELVKVGFQIIVIAQLHAGKLVLHV